MTIDWAAVLSGAGIGTAVSVLFFVGLAVGMRRALHSANPVILLSLSAALRIVVLLGVGWAVVSYGGTWAALGYAFAFFATRLAAITTARFGKPKRYAL